METPTRGPQTAPPAPPAPPPRPAGFPLPLAAEGEAVAPCPNCGVPMNGIRGSKNAVCQNCGFKDSCCF